MRYIHLYLSAIPAVSQQALRGIGIEVHAQYRAHTHLKEVILGLQMQWRIDQRQIEVTFIFGRFHRIHLGIIGAPLADIFMPVELVVRQRIQLQRIVLKIEVQILALAAVEQRIFQLCLMQFGGYIRTRIGLDSHIGFNDAIGS